MNPKSRPVKFNSEKHQILFEGIFPKTSGYVQLQVSPSIYMSKIKSRLVIKPKITPSYHMQKSFSQSAQFIKRFTRCTWFRSLMIYKPSPIFEYAHPIIIKVSSNVPKFVSVCKKQLMLSIYSWDTVDFWSLPPEWLHHCWPCAPTGIFFNQLLISIIFQSTFNFHELAGGLITYHYSRRSNIEMQRYPPVCLK